MAYWVLHVDLDQFIAAVEVRRRPELAGLPVVVGGAGDPTQRGVVATASYAARAHGVRSGMPLRTAARRCPDAVFLPADKAAYDAASAQVMAVLRGIDGVVVEVMGWDEAFVGADTGDPGALAQAIRTAVRERTGLSCSVGIGDNLLRAKLATGFAKPAAAHDAPAGGEPRAGAPGSGVFRLTAGNWEPVMAERPTTALWGVGSRTAARLAEQGIRTVRELAAADPARLAARMGPTLGPYFVQLGRGIGRARVEGTPWQARSRSREATFQQDLTDWDEVRARVAELATLVAADTADEGRPAARVAVKVRFAPFSTHTRSATLEAPTDDPDRIVAAALRVLELFAPGRPVRLLGVRAEFARR